MDAASSVTCALAALALRLKNGQLTTAGVLAEEGVRTWVMGRKKGRWQWRESCFVIDMMTSLSYIDIYMGESC